MDNKLTNVLLCSSVIQVVNFKCFLEKKEILNKSNNFIIINHEALGKQTIKKINYYSELFKFKTIDFTEQNYKINLLISELNFTKTLKKINFYRNIKKNYNLLIKIEKEIKTIISEKIGKINNVVLRGNYGRVDSIICRLIKNKKIFLIDDGVVDYHDVYWALKTINLHEIKHYVRDQVSKISNIIVNSFFCKDFSKFYKIYYHRSDISGLHYYNFNNDKKISLTDEFKKTIKFLYNNSKQLDEPQSNKKIIIIGGLIGDDNFNKFPINKEIKTDIFKCAVDKIKKIHDVSSNNIWYLRHPRLPYKNWLNLKEGLDCSFYNYDDFRLAEVVLCNPNILAVYSVSSTALLHASKILNLESCLINILSFSKFIHPSSYMLDFNTLKINGIKKELIIEKNAIKKISEYSVRV